MLRGYNAELSGDIAAIALALRGPACGGQAQGKQDRRTPNQETHSRTRSLESAEAHPYKAWRDRQRVLLEVEVEAEDAGGSGVEQEQIVGGGDHDFANDGGACAGDPGG